MARRCRPKLLLRRHRIGLLRELFDRRDEEGFRRYYVGILREWSVRRHCDRTLETVGGKWEKREVKRSMLSVADQRT